MPDLPRRSVRSRLLMSHLAIALTGLCLLLASLYILQRISTKTGEVAQRYGPESESYMHLLNGVQQSIADTFAYTLLKESSPHGGGLKRWDEEVVPALDRLRQLKGGDEAFRELDGQLAALRQSLAAAGALATSSENEPADVIYMEEIRPILDALKSGLLAARYEDPDPSEAPGLHEKRLAEVGYAWGATAVSEGALRDFLRFGTQAEEMLFRYWSEEVLKSLTALSEETSSGGGKNVARAETMIAELERYNEACARAIAARKAPDWNRALYLLREETGPLADDVTDRLNAVAFNRSAETMAMAQRLDETTASSRRILIVIGSLLAFFGIWISGWQTVQITRPLIELAEASRELADERYSRDLPVNRNDEIGFVVASFNAMRHSLRARKAEVEATQKALRQSEARYRLMTEVSPTPYVAIHEDRLIYANRAFSELMTGEENKAAQFSDRLVDEVLGDTVRDGLRAYIGDLQDNPDAGGIEQLVRLDGERIRYIEFRGAPICIDGKEAVLLALHDVTERKQVERDLRRLNTTDALTEVANRRALDDELESLWIAGCGQKTPLSFILVDIDFFKLYNDNYGHQAGDICLRSVAQLLQKSIRAQGGDLLARYGGEEFAFLLPDTTTDGACLVADRALASLRGANIPHEYSKVSDHVSISMGICTLTPTSSVAMTTIIEKADEALYRAKEGGRNRRVIAAENEIVARG